MKIGTKPTLRLISKMTGISYIKYQGEAVRLSTQPPATVDEVILSLDKHPKLQRKITTFRDSNGGVIERAFDYFDKPYKNIIYSNTENLIGEDFWVASTTKKKYVLDRIAMEYYKDFRQFPDTKRDFLWSLVKTETNHVAQNLNSDEMVQSQVSITQTKKNKKLHRFVEFPHIKNNKKKNKPVRFLSFIVNPKDNSPIPNSIRARGVKVPENDSYLGFRALTINDAKNPFAKRFIEERGLKEMNITVNTEYNPLFEANSKFKALFSAETGVINYNRDYKFKSKSEVAKTSAHEVEHGWQYYLQGRLKGGDTPWQSDIAQKFGKIKEADLEQEAKEYDYSIENYVPYWIDRVAYKKNKIEEIAHQKGDFIEAEYNNEGKIIRNNFPYIPQELL